MILRIALFLDEKTPWFDLHYYADCGRVVLYHFSIYWPVIEWRAYKIRLPKL